MKQMILFVTTFFILTFGVLALAAYSVQDAQDRMEKAMGR